MNVPLPSGEMFSDNELVIDSPDVEDTVALLRELDPEVAFLRRDSQRLDLALLRFLDIEPLRDKLPRDLIAEAQNFRVGTPLEGLRVPTLDVLLLHLRRQSEERRGRPVLIGKNRDIGAPQGAPHFGGGEGDPEPIPDQEGFQLGSSDTRLGEGIRVGLVDSRLFQHPKLKGSYDADYDTLLRPFSPERSSNAHAVFGLGLMVLQAPAARYVVRRVLDDDAIARDSWEVAERTLALLDDEVHLIDFPIYCKTLDDAEPLVMRRMVEKIGTIILVAAAGNIGPKMDPIVAGLKAWPAASEADHVLSVGAKGSDGREAAFSPPQDWVEYLAPGTNCVSTFLEGEVTIVRRGPGGETVYGSTKQFGPGGFAKWEGTSFSAAHMTGALAAILSQNPGMTPADLVKELMAPASVFIAQLARHGIEPRP